VACTECDRLSKREIECRRLADVAQLHLQAFSPEPPFGEATIRELRALEQSIEKCRASFDTAHRERIAHLETHALTMSR